MAWAPISLVPFGIWVQVRFVPAGIAAISLSNSGFRQGTRRGPSCYRSNLNGYRAGAHTLASPPEMEERGQDVGRQEQPGERCAAFP